MAGTLTTLYSQNTPAFIWDPAFNRSFTLVTMRQNLNAQTNSSHLNCTQLMSICLRPAVRLFHSLGPAAAKHWSPKLL